MKLHAHIWEPQDAKERPDKALALRLGLSRSRLQGLAREGHVKIDNHPHDLKSKIRVGSVIEVMEPDPEPLDLEAEALPLEILYEDTDLIALNKAAGMVVHPGAGHRGGTLVSALLHHCRGSLSGIGGVERPGIVHRLDKETSGIIIVAKNDKAHHHLAAQFKGREIEKYYLAYVVPVPRRESGTWDGAIGRHPVHRKKMAVLREGGRPARTDFRVLRRFNRACLLELRIFTGRTHQIRVHCAGAGCPVAGDEIYGRRASWLGEAGVTRQLLHAVRMVFQHPRSGKKIELSAPVPEDFTHFEQWLHEHNPEASPASESPYRVSCPKAGQKNG